MIEEGTQATEFELATDEGTRVRLSDLRGKPVVTSIPKDDTKPEHLELSVQALGRLAT